MQLGPVHYFQFKSSRILVADYREYYMSEVTVKGMFSKEEKN